MELDSSSKIRDPQLVQQFLSRLGSRYEILLAKFNHTYYLIQIQAGDGTTKVVALIFDKASMTVEKKNQQIKHLKKLKAECLGLKTMANQDLMILKISYYTYFCKNNYTTAKYWDFHQELKE